MKVLITGITGQDGSYLAELLLERGCDVYGLVRRCSTSNLSRIQHLLDKKEIQLVYGDMTDAASLDGAVRSIMPHYVYNLAAQSFVGESWRQPTNTFNVIAGGTLNLLEAVRKFAPDAKFYQASSSEMFGHSPPPQSERTDFYPRSPYGIAKLAAHWVAINYRESYGMPISCGILFNHESKRRGLEFVTRKISHGVAQIVKKKQQKLLLGNLEAKRDWGHARDYMEAAILIMNETPFPGEYVVGTGVAHSVKEFVEAAFRYVNLPWEDYVAVDPMFIRPAEVNHLLADPTKITLHTGWAPKISFESLVREMVETDLANNS